MGKKRQQRVLLVEPAYNNKYPPLGLMRIATAHILKGDIVDFVKGIDSEVAKMAYDKVYVTSLFTFDWKITIDTIRYYASKQKQILVGGILASLMPDEVEAATGVRPYVGPFHGNFMLPRNVIKADTDIAVLCSDIDKYGVDFYPPDYGIFEDVPVPYRNILVDSYLLRSSKGCHRGCSFCSVKTIEPKYISRIRLTPHIQYIVKRWGEKKNLVLLDDNVLESEHFDEIIDEIRELGFYKGAKLNGRRRNVDFNQGIDVRLLTQHHLEKLATIELRPLRLAFDNYNLRDTFVKKIEWAIELGFREISTYVLYNYTDSPADLYRRLRISCQLNEKYGVRIYSFPMKYVPCTPEGRAFLGPKWTRRQIRGVQCILNAFHGIAPTKPCIFLASFGKNVSDFQKIINMPEDYIIKRYSNKNNDLCLWNEAYSTMTTSERRCAKHIISQGKGTFVLSNKNPRIADFLLHYQSECKFK